MASTRDPSGGRPSDPRDLIFHKDRDTDPVPRRAEEKRFHLPRITLSLLIGALCVWFYAHMSDWVSGLMDPVFPMAVYHVSQCLIGALGFVATYRLLRT